MGQKWEINNTFWLAKGGTTDTGLPFYALQHVTLHLNGLELILDRSRYWSWQIPLSVKDMAIDHVNITIYTSHKVIGTSHQKPSSSNKAANPSTIIHPSFTIVFSREIISLPFHIIQIAPLYPWIRYLQISKSMGSKQKGVGQLVLSKCDQRRTS